MPSTFHQAQISNKSKGYTVITINKYLKFKNDQNKEVKGNRMVKKEQKIMTSQDKLKSKDISKIMDTPNCKSRSLIKDSSSSNMSYKIRSSCKDKSPKTPSKNSPLSQHKSPTFKTIFTDRYSSKESSKRRLSDEILTCKNSSPSKDKLLPTIKVLTKELPVPIESSFSNLSSQSSKNLPINSYLKESSLAIDKFSTNSVSLNKKENMVKTFSSDKSMIEKISGKERTKNNATKNNHTEIHNRLVKERTRKLMLKHRNKILKSKSYSRSRFYRFRSCFGKESMLNNLKARLIKGSRSLKKNKLLEKFNIRSSLEKDHKYYMNVKLTYIDYEETKIEIMNPEK